MLLRRSRPILGGLALAGLLTLTACGSSDGDTTTARDSGPTSVSPVTSPASSSAAPAGACTYTPDGMPSAKKVDLPPADPTVSGDVPATIVTNRGDLKVTLDAKNAPCTVNSFVSLAKQGYFHDTTCHRLTTQGIFVLQCGDPTATGTGGPGYQFDDELTGQETYPAGTLAMANAGPNTNGSQFFVVYADTQLPPSYTVFGHLDAASVQAVVKVAQKGTKDGGPDGPPKKPVDIENVKTG
jgi:peptidyl-prolyl cis-trans isomerase B (cyclophilin B)